MVESGVEDKVDGDTIKIEKWGVFEFYKKYFKEDIRSIKKKRKSIHARRKRKCKRSHEENEETALFGAIDEGARLPDLEAQHGVTRCSANM